MHRAKGESALALITALFSSAVVYMSSLLFTHSQVDNEIASLDQWCFDQVQETPGQTYRTFANQLKLASIAPEVESEDDLGTILMRPRYTDSDE